MPQRYFSNPETFWSKTVRRGECQEWIGTIDRKGYGVFEERVDGNRHVALAHRRAYELTTGAIPPGMLICHKCDNPPCVNPAHLFVGSHKDNTRDMLEKWRGVHRPLRGENHGMARLTWEEIQEIRATHPQPLPGEKLVGIRVTAAKYGVTRQLIRLIATYRLWKYPPEEWHVEPYAIGTPGPSFAITGAITCPQSQQG